MPVLGATPAPPSGRTRYVPEAALYCVQGYPESCEALPWVRPVTVPTRGKQHHPDSITIHTYIRCCAVSPSLLSVLTRPTGCGAPPDTARPKVRSPSEAFKELACELIFQKGRGCSCTAIYIVHLHSEDTWNVTRRVSTIHSLVTIYT